MNLEKSKVMTNRELSPILVNGVPIGYVEGYVYFGKQISFSNRNLEEISRRGAISWKSTGK